MLKLGCQPELISFPMNRWLKNTLSIVVWLGLATACSWVIATYLEPQPLGGVLWLCVGISLLAGLMMIPYTEVEAAYMSAILLALALISGPTLRGHGLPALPDIIVSAVVTGFLASRVLRIDIKPRPVACEGPVNSDFAEPLDSTDAAGGNTVNRESDEEANPSSGDGELVGSADGDSDGRPD